MSPKRLYAAVAACALVVYAGALWNRFAMDDLFIIALNPLVHAPSGIWAAFGQPYWPPDLGGKMYRPLPVASFALGRLVDGPAWFHAVNLVWHAGASVAVAALARRWAGATAAGVAGLIFAVHPVHVEAVANVVGRAELMAGLFACLAVYAALGPERVGWSAAALAGGMLSKENVAVVPGLVVWGWMLGLSRPGRRRMLAFAVSWVALAAAFLLVRWAVLHPYARLHALAPVFGGEGFLAVRLTAIAALADVVRLLVIPFALRADYSVAERTVVATPWDGRFALGLLAVAAWAALLGLAWRRGRRVEAFGLGWIAIAFLPVANLLFPTGILLAERTLYLPSMGLALAVGAALRELPPRRLRVLVAGVVIAGGVRAAFRVPVWRDDPAVTVSILEDSPRSYRGPARSGDLFQRAGQAGKTLDAYRAAAAIFDGDPAVFVAAADAAFTLGRPQLADSLLGRADRLCPRCPGLYRVQAAAALARGDAAVADSLVARAGRLAGP